MAMKAMDSKLDEEWIQLILTARALGITKEEIREFLLLPEKAMIVKRNK